MKVKGSVGNITQFDDGSDDFNITGNTTKYVTIPANSTITSAVLSSKGNSSFNQTDNTAIDYFTNDQFWGISLIPGTNEFFATSGNQSIYKINKTRIISSYNINDTHGIGFNFSSVTHNYTAIKAIDSEIFYVAMKQGIPPYVLKGNYTEGINGRSSIFDYYNLTIEGDNRPPICPFGLYVSSDETTMYVTNGESDNIFDCIFTHSGYEQVYTYDITNCTDNNCRNSYNYSRSKQAPSIKCNGFDSPDGNTFYCGDTYYVNIFNDYSTSIKKYDSSFTLISTYTINSTQEINDISVNDTRIFYSEINSQDELIQYDFKYPEDVIWKINGTELFNQPGVLDTTNVSVNLSPTMIQDMLISGSLIDFVVTSSDWYGYINLYDLEIIYDTSNAAILTISSPAQITATINYGDSYTENDVNITNTGDYNATSLSFETVSATGTPNYNNSISYSCSDVLIDINNSVLCNVTFGSLTQNPESDEKLKLRSVGTNLGALVYSDTIDVDITVTSSGGGGGGAIGPDRCNWRVWTPRNQIMSLIGSYGYKSNWKTIQIYNNETFSNYFTFSASGLDCEFEESDITVEGSSFGNNRVQCVFPPEEDTGQVIINGGGCSSSINVVLTSNVLGLIFTYIGGGAGLMEAFIIWAAIIIGIFGLVKVFQ